MSWAVWLVSLVPALARKLLVALGVGAVTYTGFATVQAKIVAAITANLGSISGPLFQFFALVGGVDLIGIWLGALAAVAALYAFSHFSRLASA